MQKNTLDLLIGNLWQVDSVKLTALCQNSGIPLPQLRQITMPLAQQSQTLSAEVIRTSIPPVVTLNQKAPVAPREAAKPYPAQALINNNSLSTSKPQLANTFENMNWEQLAHKVSICENCKLCENRTQTVLERGNRNAKWMFIGEGPGEQEDLQGRPFVGASGQLLDKMIAAMKLNTENDVYIANVIKCRPPRNRNPEPEEISSCKNYLLQQINLVKPQIIITLGRYAVQTLLDTELAVGKLRGKLHHYQDIPLIATYHPSYLLRTPSAKKDTWEDLQLAMRSYNIQADLSS